MELEELPEEASKLCYKEVAEELQQSVRDRGQGWEGDITVNVPPPGQCEVRPQSSISPGVATAADARNLGFCFLKSVSLKLSITDVWGRMRVRFGGTSCRL